MSLLSHNMHLTEEQVKRLMRGQAVMLKHHHLSGGGVEVFLTRRQATKAEKFHNMGKGMKLHMSERQISHNMKGSGAFSWLKEAASKLIKKVAPQAREVASRLIQNHGSELINKGAAALQDSVGNRLGVDLAGAAKKYGNAGLEQGVAAANAAASKRGYGFSKPKRLTRPSMHDPNQANEGPRGVTTIGPNIVPSQLPLVPHPTTAKVRRGKGRGSGIYA